MMSFKKALVLSALLLFFIFFFYPRSQTPSPFEPEPSPEVNHAPGAKPPTSQPTSHDLKVESGSISHYTQAIYEGPETPTKQQQMSASNLKNLPLQDQLAYQFPYRVSSKFPAYIWQTWKYTPASPDFKEEFRVTEASWTEKHPNFVHEVAFVSTFPCKLLLILSLGHHRPSSYAFNPPSLLASPRRS